MEDSQKYAAAEDLSIEFLGWVTQQIQLWSSTIMQAAPCGEQRDRERRALERVMCTLGGWHQALLNASGFAPPVGSGSRRFVHDSRKILECIRLASYLQGGADHLSEVMQRALQCAAPRLLSGALVETLRQPSVMPSPALIRRYELALDIALVLAVRKRADSGAMFRFGHADSSPIAGFDWLWSQHMELRASSAPDVLSAMLKLGSMAEDRRRGAGDAPPAEWAVQPPSDECKALLLTLQKSFFEVINPPAALGSGLRGLANKASHMAFAWALHCPSQRPPSSYTGGFRSMTTDMGVELSLADFHCDRLEALFPEWVIRGGLDMDVDRASSGSGGGEGLNDAPVDGAEMTPSGCECESVASEPDMGSAGAVDEAAPVALAAGFGCVGGGADEEREEQEPDAAELAEADHDMRHRLMPFCLTVPGLQHITNNLCNDVHCNLQHFGDFWKELKNLEALLRVDERRARYVFTCLRGSPLAYKEPMFNSFTYSLYESRWRAVLDFLGAVEPMLPVLAATFDAQRYRCQGDGAGVGREAQREAQERQEGREGLIAFDPSALSATLRSGLFFHYAKMCLMLESIPPQLAAWGETCVCHEPLARCLSEHLRCRLMELHYGPGIHTCPCAGMRAPELSTGKLEEVVSGSFQSLQGDLHELRSAASQGRANVGHRLEHTAARLRAWAVYLARAAGAQDCLLA